MTDLEHLLGQLADEGHARGAAAVFDAASGEARLQPSRRRRRGGAAIAAVVAVALVAGGVAIARSNRAGTPLPKNSSVLSVVTATESSDSARFETTMESVERGETVQRVPGTVIEGAMNFADHMGAETQTYTDHREPPEEVRFVGGRVYQRLDAADAKLEYNAPAGKTWITNGAIPLEFEGCPLRDPVSSALGVSANSLTPANPDTLLGSLRDAGAALVRVGTASVRGTATTHWRVDTAGVTTTTAAPSCSHGLAGFTQSAPRIEIWTDAQNRLRRIEFTTITTVRNLDGPSGPVSPRGGKSTIVNTTTTDLFDFGTSVSVSPPPAGEVDDITDALIGYLAGPGTVAPDKWHHVASGMFAGKSWTVWYARTTTGWRCYQTEGVPAPEESPDLGGGDGMPKRSGQEADCLPAPGGLFENGAFTAILGGVEGHRWLLVGRVDDSESNARLVFSDGTSTALTIDPTTRLVQWSGPATPTPAKVVTGDDTCSLDDNADDECQGADLGPDSSGGGPTIQPGGALQLPPGVTRVTQVTGGTTAP